MAKASDLFLEKANEKAFDLNHRRIINFNIARYDAAVAKGKLQYSNIELARKRASFTKWKAIENLEKHLLEFENNASRKGIKVIWAPDAEAALREIQAIVKRHAVKMVVKSKSMVTEEIHLNDHLESWEVESVETDLGEYIQQLDGEPPYHIVTPAMHKSKETIAELFHKKLGTPLKSTPEELTQKARELLREKYTSAGMGVTGANFLIADSGSICITENEGNGRLSFCFPKVHVAIAGIEKVLPNLTDLDLFFPLLATFGTGQQMTAYNSIISGPRKADEIDGPEEMYVILLDNGRTNLLAQPDQRQGLQCIRCGACLNACPVYKNIGGHTYAVPYTGPIGKVITPHLLGMAEYKHLSYASSLCGGCTDVCPVKIDIHKGILYNRRDAVTQGLVPTAEKTIWYVWRKTMSKRKRMNQSASVKNFMLKNFFKGAWGDRRSMPVVADKSFNELWSSTRGNQSM